MRVNFKLMNSESIEELISDLPDRAEARLFHERLTTEHPRVRAIFKRDRGLLSDALALAAWSPLLATTLIQHPDYLAWLARERTTARVRSVEELGESLARFASTGSTLQPQVLLARFRRRELLRIYLADIRRTLTLVEVTEELSNLADAVLAYALNLARQEQENMYGAPLAVDGRGRSATARFSIVALGKLGSRELNYASDIDLLFLYSEDGTTTDTGTRGALTNREYFVKLSERIARTVGGASAEGAAYRVDLRLRPHGRDGALCPSLAEAARYYVERAQAWELQALIRSRSAAGSGALFDAFAAKVRERVYTTSDSIAGALANVRIAKSKIDQQHNTPEREFNVKLGQGGIREIEFIAQALQLAFGGEDEWLRAAHTLVSLGRLAERNLITDAERTRLFDAYTFLRTLEHRLQMEQGLQTHSVPDDPARRTLVARRMNCTEPDALLRFNRALDFHTENVRATYERVFGVAAIGEEVGGWRSEGGGDKTSELISFAGGDDADVLSRQVNTIGEATLEKDSLHGDAMMRGGVLRVSSAEMDTASLAFGLAQLLSANVAHEDTDKRQWSIERLAQSLHDAALSSLNARRALTFATRIAASLAKASPLLQSSAVNTWTNSEARQAASAASHAPRFSVKQLVNLVRFCGASEFFADALASNPALVADLPADNEQLLDAEEFAARISRLREIAARESETFAVALATLRQTHARVLVEIGMADALRLIQPREANRRQTELAVACINAGYAIAARELARRFDVQGAESNLPRMAVLGLGRLGGGGMDYGSDLDLVLVYDETSPSPVAHLTHDTAYSLFAELLVAALSSLTRDGYLYRVDLRLRPDGKNGVLVRGANSFLAYLRERTAAWELLAYVKLHAAAGNEELGARVMVEARGAMHEAARRIGRDELRAETRRVRDRLEKERGEQRRRARGIDIKFGAGGMLDVYFATRYLQLCGELEEASATGNGDLTSNDGQAAGSTTETLGDLRERGLLKNDDWRILHDGYTLLRTLDHYLRLLLGRGTQLPAPDSAASADLARCVGFDSSDELLTTLTEKMRDVRATYNRITA